MDVFTYTCPNFDADLANLYYQLTEAEWCIYASVN